MLNEVICIMTSGRASKIINNVPNEQVLLTKTKSSSNSLTIKSLPINPLMLINDTHPATNWVFHFFDQSYPVKKCFPFRINNFSIDNLLLSKQVKPLD